MVRLNNEEIAEQLLSVSNKLNDLAKELLKNARKHKPLLERPAPIELFSLPLETLKQHLQHKDIDELKTIVRHYGLDPTGQRVRKWKNPEKIREYIIERQKAMLQKSQTYN